MTTNNQNIELLKCEGINKWYGNLHALKDVNFTKEFSPKYQAVKEAVLPFKRFPGSDTLLGPEMRSTGEVMGLA